MAKARKLKLFNGGLHARNRFDPRWESLEYNQSAYCYVAAYSVADLLCMLREYYGGDWCPVNAGYVRKYWHKGCWGNSMAGVPVERGVWISFGRHSGIPVRVYPVASKRKGRSRGKRA